MVPIEYFPPLLYWNCNKHTKSLPNYNTTWCTHKCVFNRPFVGLWQYSTSSTTRDCLCVEPLSKCLTNTNYLTMLVLVGDTELVYHNKTRDNYGPLEPMLLTFPVDLWSSSAWKRATNKNKTMETRRLTNRFHFSAAQYIQTCIWNRGKIMSTQTQHKMLCEVIDVHL